MAFSADPGVDGTGARARAHLARLEAALRAASGSVALPGPVLILGGGPRAVALAAMFAAEGLACRIREPDDRAATRAREMLARRGVRVAVETAAGTQPPAPLRLETESEGAGAGALLLGLVGEGAARGAGLDLHSGAPGSRLAEVLRLPGSSAAALAAAGALARRLGRAPLEVAGGQGLAATLAEAARAAAHWMALRGAEPWEIDDALRGFGFARGPFEAEDLAGLAPLAAPGTAPGHGVVAARMLAEGRLGRAAGVGWYRYPGGGGAVVDPLVADTLAEEARFAGVARRSFEAAEMQARVLAAMLAAAQGLIARGVAPGPDALDLVSVHGCGYPAASGGLMWHAREAGPGPAADAAAFTKDDPAIWPATPGAVDNTGRG